MNHLTTSHLDARFVQDRQLALVMTNTHSGSGSIRRAAGVALIRLGEWMRGKAESRPESTATTLKAA